MECGTKLLPRRTKCSHCEALKNQSLSEKDLNAQEQENEFKQSSSKIEEDNQKPKKIWKHVETRRSCNDDTGAQDLESGFLREYGQGSFCGACGFELATSNNFCPGCGRKRNSNQPSKLNESLKVSPKNKKTISPVPVITFFLLAIGIGFIIFTQSNDSYNWPTTPMENPAASDIPPENPAASNDYTNNDGIPIDVSTKEYNSGRIIGEEFYRLTDPFANPPYTGEEVCWRALNTPYIFSFGKYLAIPPKTKEILATTDGFQGCLDGFDGIPME